MQSASAEHVVGQALPLQPAYGAQLIGEPAEQVPVPLHMRAGVTEPLLHTWAAQTVLLE